MKTIIILLILCSIAAGQSFVDTTAQIADIDTVYRDNNIVVTKHTRRMVIVHNTYKTTYKRLESCIMGDTVKNYDTRRH